MREWCTCVLPAHTRPHRLSKYGWRLQPVTVTTSRGLIIPIGAVFGLNEDTQSLIILHRAFQRHCLDHGVDTPVFTPIDHSSPAPVATAAADATIADYARNNLTHHVYSPEWEAALVAIMRDQRELECILELLPPYDDTPTLHTDGGTTYPAFCKVYSRRHTICGKHLNAKVGRVYTGVTMAHTTYSPFLRPHLLTRNYGIWWLREIVFPQKHSFYTHPLQVDIRRKHIRAHGSCNTRRLA